MHKSLFASLIWPAAAVVAVTAGCHRKSETEKPQVPEIEVAQAVTDSLTLYKSYPGTLISNNAVEVVGRVNGTLEARLYNPGDKVRKGQPLFRIESRTYRDAVERARAQLATAKSTNEYATRQYEAMKKALESDAVSQMEVLQAKSSMEESEASIRLAQAELNTAQTNLSYCTVTAPFDGVMSTNVLDPGAYIAGGVSPVKLASIYDNSSVTAVFYIEDDSYMRMFETVSNRDGIDYSRIPLEFSETLPHSYTADLTYMAPSVDTSTGTLKLQASVDNPNDELKQGMYVSVKLPWKTDPRAVLVKDASISTDQLGKYIYTVNDSNKVVYTPIVIGDLYQDTLRVVTSGIGPDTRYVTKAMLKVRQGMEIKPVMTR